MTTTPSGDTNSSLQTIIDRSDWRKQLAEEYESTAARLLSAYNRMLPRLREAAGAFSTRINEWVTSNPDSPLSAGNVRGFKQFQDLLARVELETNDFAVLLRNEAGILQEGAVVIGSDGALELAQKTSGARVEILTGGWNRPAPEALAALIGYVDSDPFRERTAMFGENAANNISDVILSSVAQGKNPRMIAGIIANWFSVPYAWADNTVRTVQLYSYRAANHATYAANSDVLDGWVWTATLDARTCISCIAQHGTKYPLTQTLNDHHRGRCTPVPLVKGTRWYDSMKTGVEWFEALPVSAQQVTMGMAMWNAWNSGAIRWEDMSVRYSDPVYGDMLRAASVSGVLGNSEAQRYYSYGK